MRQIVLVGTTLLASLLTPGCANIVSSLKQLSAAEAQPSTEDGQTLLAYYPQVGFVRGSRPVLANLGSPLEPAPGLNRAVEACREAAWTEAVKLGAREIEAVSAGPERLNEKGQFVGPVRMRITYYKLLGGYEVREARLMCVVDPEGKLVHAST